MKLDSSIEGDVVREIYAHIEDKRQELVESGLSKDKAMRAAIRSLGSPKYIAKQMYEVYSQGSWRHALFAALPHLLVALFFAMHWWRITAWLSPVLIAAMGVVIYGWVRGKPAWLFSWLGYCLTPVVVIGILLTNLTGSWALLAVIVYVPLALLLILPIAKKIIERDWIFASLMLLPIPVLLGWKLALGIGNTLYWQERLYDNAQLIAFTFVVLALAVATFMRTRQRWAKTGMLVAPEIIVLIIVASAGNNVIGVGTWLIVISLSLILIVSPALLDSLIRRSTDKSSRLRLHNKRS